MKLKQNSFETISKQFSNCFVSVLFQFHFNYADSFRRFAAPADAQHITVLRKAGVKYPK